MHYQTFSRHAGRPSDGSRRNVIKVNGEGKVSVRPDQAKVTLGASTEDRELAKAQEENAAIISRVQRALRGAGIPEDRIQTTDYSIFPQYDYIEGKQVFRGYRVLHLLLVTVEPIEKTGAVVDMAVANGANTVSGIVFETSRYTEVYLQALSLAVLNAREKAETIAATIGVRLAPAPISVTETVRRPGEPIPYETSAFVKSAAATPIQPGTMEVISQVAAEFLYE